MTREPHHNTHGCPLDFRPSGKEQPYRHLCRVANKYVTVLVFRGKPLVYTGFRRIFYPCLAGPSPQSPQSTTHHTTSRFYGIAPHHTACATISAAMTPVNAPVNASATASNRNGFRIMALVSCSMAGNKAPRAGNSKTIRTENIL